MYLLVEGQTEEAFVKQLLVPALPDLHLIPIVVTTKAIGGHRGGTVKHSDFRKQVSRLLKDPRAVAVTTLLDYQGLGTDFPGRADQQGDTSIERVNFIQGSMKEDVGDDRYAPFLFLHEFEALLFTEPEVIADVIARKVLRDPLRQVLRKFQGQPELINASPATSPSAQIENLCLQHFDSKAVFQKRTHGAIIAERIGLGPMREACPHFNSWVSFLEGLTAA